MYQAVKGMLPKNKSREEVLAKRLEIIEGPYHNHHNKGLPQFMDLVPADINEELGFDDMSAENNRIIFSSTDTIPEEYSHIPVDLDETITQPYYLKEKTHRTPRSNFYLANKLKKGYKTMRKYKTHRA